MCTFYFKGYHVKWNSSSISKSVLLHYSNQQVKGMGRCHVGEQQVEMCPNVFSHLPCL